MAVPVRDRRDQMLRCLEALLAQDHPSYEIVVVDNGSSDGTPEAVRERAASAPVPVRVERVDGPVGRSRNHAARVARGAVVAYTDSDCLPEPGWLRAVAAALEADPRLGVVQGRTLPEVPVRAGWPATIDIQAFTGRYETCNLGFRREALLSGAGFDEQPGVDGWEDTAAGFAVRKAGWEAGWAPDAVVRHDVTYPGFWAHVKRTQRNRNLARVLERHPEMRRDLFFLRVFLRPRDAWFTGAAAAVLVARRRPAAAAVLAAPYLWFLGRGAVHDGGVDVKGSAQTVIYDVAHVAGLLRGGLRNGRIVL